MKYVNLLDIIYPVRSIYLTTSTISPSELIGGTWSKIAEGSYLMAAGDNYKINTSGGQNTVTLNVNQIPSHYHNFKTYKSVTGWSGESPFQFCTLFPPSASGWISDFGWQPGANFIASSGGGKLTATCLHTSLFISGTEWGNKRGDSL